VISALEREGVGNWVNVTGGMGAWVKAGYGTVKRAGARPPA
jgi:rhodanese-related sulfurtransferase